jgi:hypothetical protein
MIDTYRRTSAPLLPQNTVELYLLDIGTFGGQVEGAKRSKMPPNKVKRDFYDAEIDQCCGSWHRFDADPDPIFHFDADLDLDPDLIPSITHGGKSKFFKTFIHSSTSLPCFLLSIHIHSIGFFLLYSFNIRKG